MTDGNTGVRRRAREMALQLLFQAEFVADAGTTEVVDQTKAREMLKRFSNDFEIEKEVADYAGEIFLGVVAKKTEVDATVQTHSAHWKISRMGLVDLTVMRIAVFEMKHTSAPIPPSVAINEAVELAKLFGSTESGAFVNGILDHVARS